MRAAITWLTLSALAGCSLEVIVPDFGVLPDQAIEPLALETGVDAPSDGPGLDTALDGPGLDTALDLAADVLAPDGPQPPFTIDILSQNSYLAGCPGGTLIGGGAFCPNGHIRHSAPSGNLWTSACTGETQNQVTVAICVSGQLAVSTNSAPFTASGVLVPCLNSGEQPVGGGCHCANLGVEKTFPNTISSGWYCGCEGPAKPFARGTAYCFNPAQVVALGYKKELGLNAPLTSTATCKGGKILIGGGCNSTASPPQPLRRSSPDTSVKPATNFVCVATQGKVQATAICVDAP